MLDFKRKQLLVHAHFLPLLPPVFEYNTSDPTIQHFKKIYENARSN